jgi:general stress protein 26
MWVKVWFQDGPKDEKLSLLVFTQKKCKYWDTKRNKMVQFLKNATSIVTGKQ